MTLARRVARLMVGGVHEGSAWLIDDEYALTALHCVRGNDGVQRTQLSLAFYGFVAPIEAEVFAFENRIDVALLKLKEPHPTPLDFVVGLSRSLVCQHDDLALHGHPAAAAKASPGGTTVLCKVVDPVHPFNGTTGKLSFDAIAMQLTSVTAGQIAGKPSSGLKGASGGPVAWNVADEVDVATGLLLEDGLSGNYLHAVPIAEIAKCFPRVESALARSIHIDRRAPRILLELTGTGRVRWSGTLNPCDVGQLWNMGRELQGSWRLRCTAKLRELGTLGKALVRLTAYAALQSLRVPDREAWNLELRALEDLHRAPDTPLMLQDGGVDESCPAAWQEFDVKELASRIHCALDSKLLALLSDDLHHSLDLGKYSNIGVKIEKGLRLAMWRQWLIWQEELENNPDLLRHFLSRIFDVDAEAKVCEDDFASIGCSIKVREQLFRATLLALSLGAAGVAITPMLHQKGNFVVAERAGHACGVETREQTNLRLFAKSVQWKSDVVFLPYLQSPLLQLYEKSVSMIRAEGTLGHAITHSPPIALTSEPDFLTALAGGASYVRSFYDALDGERNQRLAALLLAGRTEKLNV
jgi:hypothetical protein